MIDRLFHRLLSHETRHSLAGGWCPICGSIYDYPNDPVDDQDGWDHSNEHKWYKGWKYVIFGEMS